MTMFASWDDYATAHREHHKDTVGETDPDRKFLGALAIKPVSALRFIMGLATPRS
jgi:fatty-acid desaturase